MAVPPKNLDPQPAVAGGKKRRRSRTGSLLELGAIVAAAVLIAFLVQAFVVKPYKIPSGSMEPTLVPGQRVLVSKITLDFTSPAVGDIVVFHPPLGAKEELCGAALVFHPPSAPCDSTNPHESSESFIKRIVGGPGEELFILGGRVYRCRPKGAARCPRRAFHAAPEPFIKPCRRGQAECELPAPIRIPADHWFMMGDNRGESDDSRFWGPIPTAWIVGEAFATYWPPDRIGTL